MRNYGLGFRGRHLCARLTLLIRDKAALSEALLPGAACFQLLH